MARGRDNAALLESISSFLAEWQLLLRDPAQLRDERVRAMRDRAEQLRERAEASAAGGIAHHLSVCIQCLNAPSLDRRGFQEALRSLSEVAWQLEHEPRPGGDRGQAEAGARSIALPPLLNEDVSRGAPARQDPREPQPPPPISIAKPAATSKPAAPVAFGFGTSNASVSVLPARPAGNLAAAPAVQPVAPTRHAAPLPNAVQQVSPRSPAPGARPSPEAPVIRVSPAAPPGPRSPAPAPLGLGKSKKNNLLVATMFGLRAFGRGKGAPSAAAPAAPALPTPPASPSGGVLGLGRKSGGLGDAPPPWIGSRVGGLPELVTGQSNGPAPGGVAGDLDARLRKLRSGEERERVSRSESHASFREPAGETNRGERSSSRIGRRDVVVGAHHVPWWIGLVAIGLVGVVVIALLIWGRPRRSDPVAATPAVTAASTEPDLPKSRLLDNKERLKALISLVHSFGGEESPELADLVDEEAALVDEVMKVKCTQQGEQCEAAAIPVVAGTLHGEAPQNQIQHLFQDRQVTARARGPQGGSWLSGLEIPVIGAEDDPEVKHWVEYFTEHAVGRERLQTLLFRCGAYQDLVEKTLVKYGLPTDLMALVLTESGCVPDIESPVGARGLWQFMPATARAYHLHVKEGVVDERISPPKATEAAVKFLADLYRKMGSWEFAMASYNMGPFGLAARIRRAGGNVSFWDLAAAGMLPEETAKYVPRIQGYALILKNLAHFNFLATQMRAPELTAELETPAGTRLGQVARSVGTTLDHIRGLNPDLIGVSVPDLPGARFMVHVPKDSVFRARTALEQLIDRGDQADRCVSSQFDWGNERFTKQMAARCRREPGESAPR